MLKILKKSCFRRFDARSSNKERSDPVSTDISNTRLRLRGRGFREQMLKDYENGTCFICHKRNRRSDISPQGKKVNILQAQYQGNDLSEKTILDQAESLSGWFRKCNNDREEQKITSKESLSNSDKPSACLKIYLKSTHDISRHRLSMFGGTIQGVQCQILKDGGASANIVLREGQGHFHTTTFEY